MTQTAYFSEAIRPVLLREINTAKQSIYVAAAWFTDYELFSALLKRQRAGTSVAVMIDDNDINDDAGIPFHELSQAGGQFWAMTGVLMHHKFCVFDASNVITGSYNWTYRAATENQENILLTTNNPELAQQYIREFLAVTGQDTGEATETMVNRILHRMRGLLAEIVELETAADFEKQAIRLKAESKDLRMVGIVTALQRCQYAAALEQIERYIDVPAKKQAHEEAAELRAQRRELAMSWLEQGIAALGRDPWKCSIAEAHFTKSISIYPEIADAYAYRAITKEGQDDAWLDYRRAIELDPSCAVAIVSEVILNYDDRYSAQIIEKLTRAIETDPRCAIAYCLRALAKAYLGQDEAALVDYGLAIKHDDNRAISYRRRALLKEGKGDLQGALADYEAAGERGDSFAPFLVKNIREALTKAAELERQAKQ
ncbi:MAG: hypothetical protein H7330_04230 [Hymenobacteraceae bacterium]|nr:hypothetical protein [Hymenobacteraceae bacterium]